MNRQILEHYYKWNQITEEEDELREIKGQPKPKDPTSQVIGVRRGKALVEGPDVQSVTEQIQAIVKSRPTAFIIIEEVGAELVEVVRRGR